MKKKTVAKTNKQRDEKNQVNCYGKYCWKLNKTISFSLRVTCNLRRGNILAATFVFPYTFFLFVSSITTQQ